MPALHPSSLAWWSNLSPCRFDEPEGRESLVAGEPPPYNALRALNTSAVLAAFGALPVNAATTPAGAGLHSPQLAPHCAACTFRGATRPAVVRDSHQCSQLTAGPGAAEVAAGVIAQHRLDDTFYVFDLSRVLRLHQAWTQLLPRVTPFYAGACSTRSDRL